jgi:16S rRNA (guanine966-N2)-methyltransferase
MRVIAGTYRSRILRSLKGSALRPTSDRLRETLFNVLGTSVQGSRFLDLFAGTGAVGIEAISRGASYVVFIENHGPASALIRRNLESLGVRSGVRVVAEDAMRGMTKLAMKHRSRDPGFDLVFLDPPYDAVQQYERALAFLGSASLLAPGAVLIAEHRRAAELPAQAGALLRYRVLRQGDAALSFYHADGYASGGGNRPAGT